VEWKQMAGPRAVRSRRAPATVAFTHPALKEVPPFPNLGEIVRRPFDAAP
jgi:hypothetical protein